MFVLGAGMPREKNLPDHVRFLLPGVITRQELAGALAPQVEPEAW